MLLQLSERIADAETCPSLRPRARWCRDVALVGCGGETSSNDQAGGASPSSAASGASSGPTTPALPAFDAGQPLVLFANLTGAGGGIFVTGPDGSDAQQLATDVLPGVHKHPDWSPDGQSVVFIDETTEAMYVAHLDGSGTERLSVCDKPGCDYPAWSPDGKRIAFSRYESASGVTGPAAVGVYVLTLETGAVDKVVRLARPLLADVPRWSPDGSSLVFGVDKMDKDAYETGAAIATVPVAGGKPTFLTAFKDFAYAPDWSWATNQIVFSTDIRSASRDFDPATARADLYVVEPDGSGLHRVTHVRKGEVVRSPRWSPDGSAITAYDESLPGGVRIDPRTGRIRPFVTEGEQFRPQLRPTG